MEFVVSKEQDVRLFGFIIIWGLPLVKLLFP